MIFQRYLIRELLQFMTAVTSLLIVLIISNMLIHYLSIAAQGSMSLKDVVKFVGMLIPQYLEFVLPFSWFLSILFVYGKLFAQKELWVMFASGMSWFRLCQLTLWPGAILAFATGFLSCYVVPKMSAYQDQLISAASADHLDLLRAGRFIQLPNNAGVAYVGEVDPRHHQVRDVFIELASKNGEPEQIITSPLASERQMDQQFYVRFEQGHAYRLPTELNGLRLIHYQNYDVRIDVPHFVLNGFDTRAIRTIDLLQKKLASSDEQYRSRLAEFQFRISQPLLILVLTLLGTLVSEVPPRSMRYIKLIPGGILMMGYFNLVTLSRVWINQGKLSPVMGVWWVHLSFLLLGLLWLAQKDALWTPKGRLK